MNIKSPYPDPEQPFYIPERRAEPRLYTFHYDGHSEHELTGLPGRNALHEAMGNAIADVPGQFGVIFIDLDGLKELNDEVGYEAGDQYLMCAADVLHEDTSEQDVVALATHIGGDEYAILVANIRTLDQLNAVRMRLHIALDDLGIPNSMGGKIHTPGETTKELLKAAEELMHAHKLERKLAALTPEQRIGYLALARIAERYDLSLRDAPAAIGALYQESEEAFGISFGEAPDTSNTPDQETADE